MTRAAWTSPTPSSSPRFPIIKSRLRRPGPCTGTARTNGSHLRTDDELVFGMVDARIGLRCDYNALLPAWTGIVKPIALVLRLSIDWRISDPSVLTRAGQHGFSGSEHGDRAECVSPGVGDRRSGRIISTSTAATLPRRCPASLMWRINKYASLNASALFANNNSSLNTFSYKVLSAGPNDVADTVQTGFPALVRLALGLLQTSKRSPSRAMWCRTLARFFRRSSPTWVSTIRFAAISA